MTHSGVDWTDRIREGGRWRYAVWCSRCGLKRYLPNYHAQDADLCYRCSNSEKGRKWHLENPSGPERRIIRQLNEMKLPYEREVPLLWYNIDFVIGGTHAIEVNGGQIHTDLRLGHNPERAAIRLEHIRERYKLLVLVESATHNCKRVIREFLTS